MTTLTINPKRLRAFYGFTKTPFNKAMWAKHMFDSQGQRELLQALLLWTELKGISLVIGPSGAGKSITVRRFVDELDDTRFRVFDFAYLPTTVAGFLRSLCRTLELPVRHYASDLFDAVQQHLIRYEDDQGAHPILLIDDGEGLTPQVLDTIRRLTCYDLDAQDRFSLLLAGTDELQKALWHPHLDTYRTRVVFARMLRPFGLEDTRNYIRFHLERAEADPKLITEPAAKRIFQASMGYPRRINQLATQALIQGVVLGKDSIDAKAIDTVINDHPLYSNPQGGDA